MNTFYENMILFVITDYWLKHGTKGEKMGTVIIFLLITILAGIGAIRSLKDKNILGILFAGGSFLVLGWFSVMTILNSGFPP